jgi:hypothetical protein
MQPNGCAHPHIRPRARARISLARSHGGKTWKILSTGGGRYRVGSTKEMSTQTSGTIPTRRGLPSYSSPPLPSSTLRWIFVAGWEFIPRCFDQSRARAVRCRVAIKRDNAFSQETPLPRDHFQSRDWLSEFFGLIGAPRAPPRASDRAPLRLPFVRCWDRVHLYESLDTRAN